jgi:hypothetical protein
MKRNIQDILQHARKHEALAATHRCDVLANLDDMWHSLNAFSDSIEKSLQELTDNAEKILEAINAMVVSAILDK